MSSNVTFLRNTFPGLEGLKRKAAPPLPPAPPHAQRIIEDGSVEDAEPFADDDALSTPRASTRRHRFSQLLSRPRSLSRFHSVSQLAAQHVSPAIVVLGLRMRVSRTPTPHSIHCVMRSLAYPSPRRQLATVPLTTPRPTRLRGLFCCRIRGVGLPIITSPSSPYNR